MVDTACLHLRNTPNIGDLSCSPGDYLDFGETVMLDFQDEAPACDLAIMGGGKVFGKCCNAAIYTTAQVKRRVIWGVGFSERDCTSFEFDILSASCDLISTRNFGVKNVDYVPCASSLSPAFDTAPDPVHDVVLFYHERKSRRLQRPDGIPALSNHGGTMQEAIAFLASGATVVTNSYHGTFWGLCLGRRVLCLPFNKKFKQFRRNPIMADPKDWLADVARAEARDGVLEDARHQNRVFYEKVRNLS